MFAGGCTRRAAEAVCGTAPLVSGQVFTLLAALVGKSLVVAQRDGPETRYRLLETIREYGEERLAETGETETLRDGHAEYFCQLALDLFGELYGAHQIEASRRLAAENPDRFSRIVVANTGLPTGDTPMPDVWWQNPRGDSSGAVPSRPCRLDDANPMHSADDRRRPRGV